MLSPKLYCIFALLLIPIFLGKPSSADFTSTSQNNTESYGEESNERNSSKLNNFIEKSDNDTIPEVLVSPLDDEESARAEEEELEDEIAHAEEEMREILRAENAIDEEKVILETPTQRNAKVKAAAVQNLMQIFGLTESQVRSESHGPPPEFMIELYNTITDSSGVTRAKNPYGAHVVRSFLEKDASLNDYFFFNMSSTALEATESVLEAELHLFRMDTPRAQLHPSLYLNPFYVLSLYQVTDLSKLHIPDLHKLLAVQYVPALGSGWQVFNVKKPVVEWLSSHSENYGLLVSAESVQGDRVPIRFARRGETVESKQPLLVLFNHDTHMATLDPPPTQQTARKRVPKPKISNGLNSNNLDDKENEQGMDTTYETTTPLSSLENPRFHHSLLFQDSIRHPNSVSRFRSRRSRNDTDSTSNGTAHLLSSSNLTECGRHDLFVSFESIGWSSWIISPKGYNAHYCAGPCVFPLGSDASPTNHATVQSIINELNLHPGLARPCCVPTTLLPISLLYYDDNDNVVLKQYVDMVAENCGCH